MKTKRFNWAYILMCVVGLLVASCAEDDDDVVGDLIPQDNAQTPSEQNETVGIPEGMFEGVWFFVDNDKEPVDTAYLTIKENGTMTFSSVPCDSVIRRFAEENFRWYTEVPEWKDEENKFVRTATSTIETSASLTMEYTAKSDKSLYFDLTDESMSFPMRAEILGGVFDVLTIGLAPRKSIAVYDIATNQWGVFLYYNNVSLPRVILRPMDMGFKFITTKKIK